MTEGTKAQSMVGETAGKMTSALKHGAEAGAQAGAKLAAPVSAATSKGLYGACYYTAFGATFAAMAVGSLVPKDGVPEKGFHDGTEAARAAFHEPEAAALSRQEA